MSLDTCTRHKGCKIWWTTIQSSVQQFKQRSDKGLSSLVQIKNIFMSWQYFSLSLTTFFISKWKFVKAHGYLEKQGPSTVCYSTSHILLVLLSLHSKCCHGDYFLFPCFDDNGFIFGTADSEMSEDSQGPSEWNLFLPIISYLLPSYWS